VVGRPALAIGLLGAAVAVSVAHGQPSPVDRPSGVSVAVSSVAEAPPQVGDVLLVSGEEAVRFGTTSRRAARLPLPHGVRALQVWSAGGWAVVLGRLPVFPAAKLPVWDRPGEYRPVAERTAGYLVRAGRPAVQLGLADRIAPAAGGRAVWLAAGSLAVRVGLPRGERQLAVRLPPAARLVADTPAGLVATTGSTAAATGALQPPGAPSTPPPTPAANGPRAVGPGGSGGSGGGAGTTPVRSPPDPGSSAVPVTTLLVQANGLTRFLAEAEALAAAGDVVLVRRADLRLGVASLDGTRPVRWLPQLSAVEPTGPAALDAGGSTFAVLARVNDHARLMVGPTSADSEADINVVALEGGIPDPSPAPPAFTVSGRALAARPDGKVVYYYAGERAGLLLGDDLPRATAVAQG
jgi:hypothetical protein